jgi:hypothetical protein
MAYQSGLWPILRVSIGFFNRNFTSSGTGLRESFYFYDHPIRLVSSTVCVK